MSELFDFHGYGWMLWEGLQVTILVGLCALVAALAMGLLGCWGKLSGNRIARGVADAYTTIVRGVPELVLIILVYYGVTTLLQHVLQKIYGAEVLIDIDRFSAGVITIGFIYGAFAT
jgi:His/Glu/Gln/Arg/opine family amino acid ABC transporter permease subunit